MSGRKNVLKTYTVINAQSMTGTTTITGTAVNVQFLDNIGIQLKWTGTPSGTFLIEGSNDNTTYRALDFGSAIEATGSASDHLISVNQFPFPWIRVKYTNSSSTGSLTATISGKEL